MVPALAALGQMSATLKQAETVLYRYGLGALIAIGLVAWLALTVTVEIRQIKADLQHHMAMDSFYLRAICLGVNKGDWAASRTCDPQ